MKIAVIGANGKAGQLIVKEAVQRGFEVTAIVRHENVNLAQNTLKKDLFDLTYEDLVGFDAVVNAVGVWTQETFADYAKGMTHLATLLKGTETRLLVVGGAGSLYLNKEHSLTLAEAPDFPDSYKPVAKAASEGLEVLRKSQDLKWTYISPAAEFISDAPRTGSYILAGEEFTLNSKGESKISYADFAIAMVDEIEKGQHFAQRISVVAE